MTGSVATDQPTLVDRLLAYMQQRFPREFEICLLSAQNDELQAKVAQHESTEGGEIEAQQAFDFSKSDEA